MHNRIAFRISPNHLKRNHLTFDLGFFITTTDETLDGINGVFRVNNGLTFGGLPDHPLTVLGEAVNLDGQLLGLLPGFDFFKTFDAHGSVPPAPT